MASPASRLACWFATRRRTPARLSREDASGRWTRRPAVDGLLAHVDAANGRPMSDDVAPGRRLAPRPRETTPSRRFVGDDRGETQSRPSVWPASSRRMTQASTAPTRGGAPPSLRKSYRLCRSAQVREGRLLAPRPKETAMLVSLTFSQGDEPDLRIGWHHLRECRCACCRATRRQLLHDDA